MKIAKWQILSIVLVLMICVLPNLKAETNSEDMIINEISISEVELSQGGKDIEISENVLQDSIRLNKVIDIVLTIDNPERTDLNVYIDVSYGPGSEFWKEYSNESIKSYSSRDIISTKVEIDNASAKSIRLRVTPSLSDSEKVRDPNNDDNVLLLKLGQILDDGDGEKEWAWYLALVAMIPLVFVFFFILVFKIPSRYVAPMALGLTALFALIFFRGGLGLGSALVKIGSTLLYSILWGGLDYIYAIFGAFLFLKMLEKVGAMEQMKLDFKSISNDKQHQILLIGFCFAMIMATVAPAGSNFVIAAIMLVSLGFNRMGVGVLCLFGNSISSVFGLLGVSIIALKEVTGLGLFDLSGWIGIYMIFLCIPAPLIMNMVYTKQGPMADLKNPELREDLVLLLGMGAVYGTLQALVAYFSGPELPTIIAGGATLLFIIIYERLVTIKKEDVKGQDYLAWGSKGATTSHQTGPSRSLDGVVARPYIWSMGFMVFILLTTRLVIPLKDILTCDLLTLAIPFPSISPGKVMSFSPLYSPGTILLLVAFLVPFFVRLSARFSPETMMGGAFLENLDVTEMGDLMAVDGKGSGRDKRSGDGGQKRVQRKKRSRRKKAVSRPGSAPKRKKGGSLPQKKESPKTSSRKKRRKVNKTEKGTSDIEFQEDASINLSKNRRNAKVTKKKYSNDGGEHSLELEYGEDDDGDDGDYEVDFEDDDGDYEVDFEDDDGDDDYNVDFEDDDDDGDDDGDYEVDFEDDDGADTYEDDDYPDIDFEDDTEVDEPGDKSCIALGKFATALNPLKMFNLSFIQTAKEVFPIMLTIAAFMAIANVMRYFDMTYSIASNVVYLVGDAYSLFVPLIGMTGSALTGSTTTSNVLFGGLHMEAATRLGLSSVRVAAAQVIGSSAGEMISPMNAVVIATAVGMKNKESLLIKRLLPTFIFWLAISTIISVLFISLI